MPKYLDIKLHARCPDKETDPTIDDFIADFNCVIHNYRPNNTNRFFLNEF